MPASAHPCRSRRGGGWYGARGFEGDQLVHATSGSGDWTTETIGSADPGAVQLDLGPNLLHVLFERDGSLEYTRRSPANGVDEDCDGQAW